MTTLTERKNPGFHARGWRRLASDQGGMMSLLHVVVVMLLVMLFAAVNQVASTVQRRLRIQDAADAIAASASTGQARAMNSLTAANHVIGELASFLVLFEAIAGPNPGKEPQDTEGVDGRLYAAWQAAASAGAACPAFAEVSAKALSSGAVGVAKREAKQRLAEVYERFAAARSLTFSVTPSTAEADEEGVLRDYRLASELEARAIEMHAAAERLVVSLREAKQQTNDIAAHAPRIINELAREIGGKYGVESHLSGALFPVVPDPLGQAERLADADTGKGVSATQLVRATFPWVNYHRTEMAAKLARAYPFRLIDIEVVYLQETTQRTRSTCHRLQADHGLWLWVLAGSNVADKGDETWTNKPVAAEQMFGVLAIAWEPAGFPLSSDGASGQQSGFAQAAYAQAMLYNANPQRPRTEKTDLKTPPTSRQAAVGWDTLNWEPRRLASDPCSVVGPVELFGGESSPIATDGLNLQDDPFPAVRVNWQSKLVPGATAAFKRMCDEFMQHDGAPSVPPGIVERFRPLADDELRPMLSH